MKTRCSRRLSRFRRDRSRISGALNINGSPVFIPRKLSKRLNAPGALTTVSRQEVAEMLVKAFSAA